MNAGPSASAPRPNLLIVMVDQLRASALGLYGNAQVRTPHLEALAASGVLYRNAFTPYPVCVPARVAMWTGRWPHLTGSRNNSVYLQPGEVHLAQLLKEAGYATGLIGKNHCFEEADVERYFDTYYPVGHMGPADDWGDPDVAAARRWVRQMEGGGGTVRQGGAAGGRAYAAGISPFPVQKHGTWLIGNEADAFIRRHHAAARSGSNQGGERPFAAWVSIADPHTPYQVSEPYASMYPPETLELPPMEPAGYPAKPERVRHFARLLGAPEVSDDHLRFVLSIYYGMIALIDDVVGRLLATLEELGLREDTIVVFTADHGDYMAEHRLVRKGASLYDSLVKIPLLFSYPARVPTGQATDALVNLLDLFPTLARLMHLELPPGRSGQPLPIAAGADVPEREAIFAECGYEGAPATVAEADAALERIARERGRPHPMAWQLMANGKLKMVRTRDWKYVHQPDATDDQCELYDLRADPYELTNLAARPEHRERVIGFQRRLLDWCITSEDTLPLPKAQRDQGI